MRVSGPHAITSYLFILLGAVLVNNVVMVSILGLCTSTGIASTGLETFEQ